LPGKFKEYQKALGWNFLTDGLINCSALERFVGPVSMTMFDWMHCYMVHGAYQLEVGLLLGALSKAGVTSRNLSQFVSSFTWPKHLASKSSSAKHVFDKRDKITDPLKCGASEALSTYCVVRIFLISHVLVGPVSTELLSACDCFLKLCAVIDLLRLVHRRAVDPEELSSKIMAHLSSFKLLYGDSWLPKHHMTLHLPDHLLRHKTLISCFVHERKHKEIKRYADQVDNTAFSYERSVLESCLRVHLDSLSCPDEMPTVLPSLINPSNAALQLTLVLHQALGSSSAILVSNDAYYGPSQRCSRGDVVVADINGSYDICQVWFHLSCENTCYSCVSVWQKIGDNRYRKADVPVIVHLASIKDSCTYQLDGQVALIAPLQF
jgi:hypothetical protein